MAKCKRKWCRETLRSDFGIEVEFRDTTPICIERLIGNGAAAEFNGQTPNLFLATVGLRLGPAAIGTGVRFGLAVEPGSMPLLSSEPSKTRSGSPCSKASLGGRSPMTALRAAGPRVCEPVHRFRLELPMDTLGPTLPVLARLAASAGKPMTRGSTALVEGDISAANVHQLLSELPGLTGGEGFLETEFDHFRPVTGPIPVRERTDHNPLDRKEYLLHVLRHV